MQDGVIEDTLARLKSIDANDRVKAAAELGEIGSKREAPELLVAVYEDEASTVRQMAIQSYGEIMKEDGLDEIIKAAKDHFDEYTKLYAITLLGNFDKELVSETLVELMKNSNSKIRIAAVRSIIHANISQFANLLTQILREESDKLVVRNIIEALGVWKYKKAEEMISMRLKEFQNDKEIQTIAHFALACFGKDNSKKFIENEDIDEYISVRYEKKAHRGRNELLKVISLV